VNSRQQVRSRALLWHACARVRAHTHATRTRIGARALARGARERSTRLRHAHTAQRPRTLAHATLLSAQRLRCCAPPRAAGRYVLYVSLACPWANRCLTVLRLKGLEDALAVAVVHPVWAHTRPGVDEHAGWQFRRESDPPVANPAGCVRHALLPLRSLRSSSVTPLGRCRWRLAQHASGAGACV
jgi:hypothetical protein